MKNALIVVDVQNDFMPEGALGVTGGDEVTPLIKRLMALDFSLIVGSQDWHPEHHVSFASSYKEKPKGQTLFSDHCVQGTFGAEFCEEISDVRFDHIVHKGIDPAIDSYSVFFDNEHKRSTDLDAYLKAEKITDLYFAGLTTEYCILYSVLDANALGFSTHVAIDACRGVELEAGNVQRAVDKMRNNGAEIVTCAEVEQRFKI